MTVHELVTRRTPMDRLMRIVNDPSSARPLMFAALLEVGRRFHFKAPPTPTPTEVLQAVMRDERVPMELRMQAAKVLLPPPQGDDQ